MESVRLWLCISLAVQCPFSVLQAWAPHPVHVIATLQRSPSPLYTGWSLEEAAQALIAQVPQPEEGQLGSTLLDQDGGDADLAHPLPCDGDLHGSWRERPMLSMPTALILLLPPFRCIQPCHRALSLQYSRPNPVVTRKQPCETPLHTLPK